MSIRKLLWEPNKSRLENSQMNLFREYVNYHHHISLKDYSDLYQWSVENISDLWEDIWNFSNIKSSKPFDIVVNEPDKMPGSKWFLGTKLNFAENLLKYKSNKLAIRFVGEDKVKSDLTYNELYDQVARLSNALKELGVKPGDRIAGIMPNMPETIIAMLASASLGAVWSSTSPDFGVKSILDRFKQIQPKIIFVANGYYFKGKIFDTTEKLKEILDRLNSVENVIIVDYVKKLSVNSIPNSIKWKHLISQSKDSIEFIQLPFDHPLYIMYSSGTTGRPKSIVHSAGGTLIQHMKELKLHTDVTEDSVIFYYTTCGWMMWNWLVSSLSLGATLILYDGNPFYPDPTYLLALIDELKITIFGTSAKYIASLESTGIIPKSISKYDTLKTILSTGSPLSENSFDFVYNHWKSDVMLSSIAGGTDIISCFMLGNPTLPVYRGEIQCRGLGMKVESFDKHGESLINQKGELVCTEPFPSMPIYFWNDKDNLKYKRTYFNKYANIWHHGDFIEINKFGGIRMLGRSDATLNPGGVRIGTAEIYRVIEKISDISDSVVVGQKWNNDERIILFVKLSPNVKLTKTLMKLLKSKIKLECTPRHVPSKIIQIDDIPYTINGKKIEIAVKKIINGEDVINRDSIINPESLENYRSIPELKI
jgi:acetoacetyl-CoA synthetase